MDEQDPDSLTQDLFSWTEFQKALDDAFPSSKLRKDVRGAAIQNFFDSTKNNLPEYTMAALRDENFIRDCIIDAYQEVEDEKNQYIQKQNDHTHTVMNELKDVFTKAIQSNQAHLLEIKANTDPVAIAVKDLKNRWISIAWNVAIGAAGIVAGAGVTYYFTTKPSEYEKAMEAVLERKRLDFNVHIYQAPQGAYWFPKGMPPFLIPRYPGDAGPPDRAKPKLEP
ncbi:MAG: hypothetical protein FWF24_07845 [Alphaproteobacteria bacterium]|nr:hypothetical protein [Alphaproteobacteria bacterium]